MALIGAVMFGLFFFGLVVPFPVWRLGTEITRAAVSEDYSLRPLLAASMKGLFPRLVQVVPPALLSGALLVVGLRQRRSGFRVRAMAAQPAGSVLLLATLVHVRFYHAGGDGRSWTESGIGASMPHLALLLSVLVAWLGSGLPEQADSSDRRGLVRQRVVFLGLLLALPLLAAFGSSNPLTRQILFHMAPWFAVLYFLADEMAALGYPAPHLATGLAALVAVSQVAYGQAYRPYRLAGGMWQQTAALSERLGAGRGLLVDPDTKRLAEENLRLLESGGFEAGDSIWAFYDLPGLVYLVGGRSPYLPWFFSHSEGLVCRAVLLARDRPGNERLFVVANQPLSPTMNQCLDIAGAPARQFAFLGQVYSAYYGRMWMGKFLALK